ncbi:MAG: ABC transporter permease [Acidimicrobiia bacterium]
MILRRLAAGVPLLLVVTFALFVLVDLAPGDPARLIAGQEATEERVEAVRDELKLDEPVTSRYVSWLASAGRGELGDSLVARAPVSELLVSHAAVTISLVAVTLAVAVVLGFLGGVAAAVRRGSLVDRAVTTMSAVALAVPAFWLGMILVIFFSVNRRWFPAIDYIGLGEDPLEWLRHLVLPSLALAALPAAEFALQVRESLTSALSSDYVATARAKGLPERQVVLKHALRNAVVPVLTVLGYRLAQLIGGAVTVESVFVLPGLGSLAVSSVFGRDMPMLLGIVAATTVVVLVINLVVDLVSAWINPRLR